MYRPMIGPLLVLVVTLITPAAQADSGIPYVWSIEFAAAEEASIRIVPDGSGPTLPEAEDSSGFQIDASIEVMLVDLYGYPVVNFPGEDLWLQWFEVPGTIAGCTNSGGFPGGIFTADGANDADGRAVFTQPLRGGGWSEGPVTVFLNGMPAPDIWGGTFPPLPLRANSPDLSGDRLVDLTDITLFVQDLGGEYAYRSDLRWDCVINLTDIVLFSLGLGVVCP